MVFLTLLSDDLGCLEVVFKRTSLRLRSGYPFNVHYLTDGKSNLDVSLTALSFLAFVLSISFSPDLTWKGLRLISASLPMPSVGPDHCRG